ncbi:hypothetical protein, partial [Thermus scotoductus]|uniref:hypothetical protein n=1 Tax=Thermus scotoductus TaxID=37636 RepID=UPI0010032D1B
LARIYLLEEDWKALDRLLRNAPPEAYPALAEVLEEKLPEESKTPNSKGKTPTTPTSPPGPCSSFWP